jgi:hypothetical protein
MEKISQVSQKQLASWLGNKKRILTQLLISGFSYLTFPFARNRKNATIDFFSKRYNSDPDPLIFDGNDDKYFNQIEMVYRVENLKDKEIVDLGCGTGSLFFWLKSKKIKPIIYTGIDFAINKQKLEPNAYIIKNNISTFVFRNQYTAPVIVAVNTFCYLDTKTINKLFNLGIENLLVT